MCKLSIIIPVLNESFTITKFLSSLVRDDKIEVIVVDGGSADKTVELAEPYVDTVIKVSEKGRALQMNAGAKHARGEIFLFLHADTYLPKNYFSLLQASLSSDKNNWGRFDVALTGKHFMFRLIENMMNARSRMSGIATGDQAIFVKRSLFEAVGGFPEIPLMEDIALSKRLKKISSPVCLREKVFTSSRRWEKNGIWKTIFLMWKLRMAFFLGAEPQKLVKKYY